MNSIHYDASLIDRVLHLQVFLQQRLQSSLQQQLIQAGQRFRVRKAFQIYCSVDWQQSRISIDLISPVELNPQNIFALLEKLIRDRVLESSDFEQQFSTPVSLCITLSLWEPGKKHTFVCHTFTLVSTDSVCNPSEALDRRPVEVSDPPLILETTEAEVALDYRPAFIDLARLQSSEKVALDFRPTLAESIVGETAETSAIANLLRRINPMVMLTLIAASVSGGLGYYALAQQKTVQTPTPAALPTVTSQAAVVALGRIEPKGGIIKVSVANAQDSRVNRLFVKEGDRVQAGQVLAMLQGLDKKQAELVEAQQKVEIARAKLEQSRSGSAKQGEIAAQASNVARLEAQLRTATIEKQAEITQAKAKLRNAQTDYQRHQQLYEEGAISRTILDNKRENVETSQAELDQVYAQLANLKATLQQQIQQELSLLTSLSEVRPVDVKVSQTELIYTLTQVAQVKAALDDLYVRAPVAGQILKINTRVGEQVKIGEGIAELGQTEQMYAIAEVYETDVRKIKPGYRATVVSENGGFVGELRGMVEHIGLQIKKKDVLDSDPAAEKDARVVEVKVRLEPNDANKVAKLSNLQVRIRINPA
jgi:HlyD family secretion protein